jgi:hypothetical protein
LVNLFPDCIAITNKRILFFTPANLGLSIKFVDFVWKDIVDVYTKEEIIGAVFSVKPLTAPKWVLITCLKYRPVNYTNTPRNVKKPSAKPAACANWKKNVPNRALFQFDKSGVKHDLPSLFQRPPYKRAPVPLNRQHNCSWQYGKISSGKNTVLNTAQLFKNHIKACRGIQDSNRGLAFKNKMGVFIQA